MSLRVKLVAALLFMGFATVQMVGFVAYRELRGRFASVQAEHESIVFRRAVHDYLAQQGGWPADHDMAAFMRFLAERDTPAAPATSAAGARPGPPPGPDAPPSLPDSAGTITTGTPATAPRPRFMFVLTDVDYRVLLGAELYAEGTTLPRAARDKLQPIAIAGVVQAYVSTEGVTSPSPEDEVYLRNTSEALRIGGASAAVLALLLGAALAQGLSADLRGLTRAVRAMRSGDLRQRVATHGGGEVRGLADAFNEMSEALARSHESLSASNATIGEQARQLRELSMRDPLTGLYNRRHFDGQLEVLQEQARRYRRPLAVVMADIDAFKQINDTHGHGVGDQVLCRVAALYRGHLRASDLLARWGGEEFVLALPETPLADAAVVCETLRAMIEQADWSDIAPGLRVTISIGVAADRPAGGDALRRADELLYLAKEGGRNRVAVEVPGDDDEISS